MTTSIYRANSVRSLPRTRHSVHFYVALGSAPVGILAAILNLWAYYDEGRVSTWIGFVAACLAAFLLFVTWFWGSFMVMNGLMPRTRVLFLIVHGLAGSLTPLLYILSFGLQLDTVASQPIGEPEVLLYLAGVPVLALQFISGWSVLPRRAWIMLTRRR